MNLLETASGAAARALPSILGLVLFRAYPFAGYALISGLNCRANLLMLGMYAGLLLVFHEVGGQQWEILSVCTAVTSYFFLIGAVAHRLSIVWRPANSVALLSTFWILCVFAPAVVLPDPYRGPVLTLGWFISLSASSYCIDTTNTTERPSFGECLFFILVNPNVVYSERGCRDSPRLGAGRAIARCALGILTWLFVDAMLRPVAALPSGIQPVFATEDYLIFIRHQGMALLVGYFDQSALASLQIGLMGLIGYNVPECYRFPLLARSPQEFWQRWNTWIGSWARRYVFFPVSLWLRRHLKTVSWAVQVTAGVLVTFLFIGILHDAPMLVKRALQPSGSPPTPRTLVLLGFCALSLVVWNGISFALRANRYTGSAFDRIPRTLRGIVGTTATLHLLLLAGAATDRVISTSAIHVPEYAHAAHAIVAQRAGHGKTSPGS